MVEALKSAEYETILKEMMAETDRGAAIIAFSFVDEHLEQSIRSQFVPLSKSKTKALFSGPLATFEAKVQIGYALGLFSDKILSDLSLIAQIRNKFAHRLLSIKFSDPNVRELCNNLALGKPKTDVAPQFREPRGRYILACCMLMVVILIEREAWPMGRPKGPLALSKPREKSS
jgi:DNA-binding MltR family transcriptional regulator